MSMMPSRLPSSTWSSSGKPLSGTAPTRRISTFSDSSLPSGTSGAGMLGTRSMSASHSAVTFASSASSAVRRVLSSPSAASSVARASGERPPTALLRRFCSALPSSAERISARRCSSRASSRSRSSGIRFLAAPARTASGFSRIVRMSSTSGRPVAFEGSAEQRLRLLRDAHLQLLALGVVEARADREPDHALRLVRVAELGDARLGHLLRLGDLLALGGAHLELRLQRVVEEHGPLLAAAPRDAQRLGVHDQLLPFRLGLEAQLVGRAERQRVRRARLHLEGLG